MFQGMISWIGCSGPPTMETREWGLAGSTGRYGKTQMNERSKDFDLSLLQRDPGREALLSKMRGKLAGFTPPASVQVRSKAVTRRKTMAWAARVLILAALVAGNYLLLDKKHVILAKMGYEGVPSLPKPGGSMSLDERALYYTYALYDISKLRQRFGVDGYFAIDQRQARMNLEELLPQVEPATLGEISGYAPVAFKSISATRGSL